MTGLSSRAHEPVMTGTMVTVGSSDTQPEGTSPARPPGPRSGLLVAAGLVVGLGLGILFTGGPGQSDEATTQDTSVGQPEADPVTTTTTTVATTTASRLATIVPGMLDTLITAAVDRNGVSVVTAWEPSDRSPSVRSLPGGDFAVDASFEWMAMSQPNRITDQQALWVGDENRMEPIASGVAGRPVWHTRRPGQLAWLEVRDGAPTIRTARFVAGQTAVPDGDISVEVGTALVAWTDAGFLLFQPSESTLTLLDEDGVELVTVPASGFVGAGVDMVAYIDAADGAVLATADLREGGTAPWGAECHRGEFNPLSGTLLLLCATAAGTDRVEYWVDGSAAGLQSAVEHPDIADIGFTSGGLGYAAQVDSLRPASTITFFIPALEEGTADVSYPGRIQHLVSVRG